MKLVRLEGYLLVVDEELLLLVPFRKLYKSDKTRAKDYFINFLSILYYVYDPRSEFSYIVNEQDRIKEVCNVNGIDVPKFTPLELECVELYKKMTLTSAAVLLKSAKIGIEKIRKFLEDDVDLSLLDERGKPVYSVSSVITALKQIPQLAKDVTEAERTLAKEILEMGRARGGNEGKSLMDDGIQL